MAEAVRSASGYSAAVIAGNSMLRLIASHFEWDWADSPKLKGDLEQALHKLENSLNDFGQAMTTMEPEFVKKRFPNWQDLHEEFVSKTDKLVGSVNNEIRILTNMRLSREKL